MGIPYLHVAMLMAFAVLFYKAAEIENVSGPLWAMLSVLVFAGTAFGLGWGWLGCVAGQVGLFIGMGVMKTMGNR